MCISVSMSERESWIVQQQILRRRHAVCMNVCMCAHAVHVEETNEGGAQENDEGREEERCEGQVHWGNGK